LLDPGYSNGQSLAGLERVGMILSLHRKPL
jgi:hypothetical protein